MDGVQQRAEDTYLSRSGAGRETHSDAPGKTDSRQAQEYPVEEQIPGRQDQDGQHDQRQPVESAEEWLPAQEWQPIPTGEERYPGEPERHPGEERHRGEEEERQGQERQGQVRPGRPDGPGQRHIVGDLVAVQARVRRKPGVVIGIAGDELQLVTADGEVKDVAAEKVTVLRAVNRRDRARPAASRVLEAIEAANRSDGQRASFDPSAPAVAVAHLVGDDSAVAIEVAFDLLRHERDDLLAMAPLPLIPARIEQLRLIARWWEPSNHARLDPPTPAELHRLEPALSVILARTFGAMGPVALAAHPLADPLLDGRGRGPLADALRQLAGSEQPAEVDWATTAAELLDQFGDAIPAEKYHAATRLLGRPEHIDTDVSVLGSAASVYGAAVWLNGGPAPSHIDPDAALDAPPALVEGLLSRGMLGVEAARNGNGRSAEYVLGRLDPASVPADALERLGHREELARRYFLDHEREPLLALTGPEVVAHQARELIRSGEYAEAVALTAGHTSNPDVAAVYRLAVACHGVDVAHLGALAADDPTIYPLLAEVVPFVEASRLPAGVREVVLLRRALTLLLDWDFEATVEVTRTITLSSAGGPVLDEAYNLLACAHWHLGNDDAAIRALLQAAKEGLSEPLLVNIGIVAGELETFQAIQHLARLVEIAPDPLLRVHAARKATTLWQSQPIQDGDDPNGVQGAEGVPPTLRQALRLMLSSQIDLDAFRDIADFVAAHDPGWFAEGSWRTDSPHADSPEARVLLARVDGTNYLESLRAELAQDADNNWLKRQAGALVSQVMGLLYSRSSEVDVSGAALRLLTLGYEVTALQRVQLAAAGTIKATERITRGEAELSGEYLTQMLAAETVLRQVPQQSRAAADDLLRDGFTAYASYLHAYRAAVLASGAVLEPATADDRRAYRELCHETVRAVDAILPRSHRHVRPALAELRSLAQHRLGALTGGNQ